MVRSMGTRARRDWKDAIAAAIRRSSAVVVCIGPSVASAWQEEELRSVLGGETVEQQPHAVIPLLLPGADPASLPRSLSRFSWTDLRNGLDDTDQVARLLTAIGAAADSGEHAAPSERSEYDKTLAMFVQPTG